MIYFRNHPSIAVWESNNGLDHNQPIYSPKATIELVDLIAQADLRDFQEGPFYPLCNSAGVALQSNWNLTGQQDIDA